MPVVWEPAALEAELVEPFGRAVVAVEDVCAAGAAARGLDGLERVVEVRFHDMVPAIAYLAGAARAGREAELCDVAVDGAAGRYAAAVLDAERAHVAAVAPVGAAIRGARHDGQHVPELEGRGDAVRRVGPERLVVGPASVGPDVGRVAEHRVRRPGIAGVVAVEVSRARLRLVVDRQVEDRLR